MALAFKEWSYIVEALSKGKQNIIFRKGGIAEDSSDFEVKGNKFILFPTLFHQAESNVKKEWFTNFDPQKFHKNPDKISIEYFAEIADTRVITDWNIVSKLYPYHAWNEKIIEERFNRWEKKVHLLIVQVYKLNEAKVIDVLPEYSGCKSWIDIDYAAPLEGTAIINKSIVF